ncbi:energy transducer TonB [Brevundimonas lenta]|uniref:TonB C-terminal domain-containing protein n=1 Tax=Brevundimonas lenta TaxID=424796 RepID=A0A7W6JA64_9CAUL|nr:energy transducer TonB [Brevundimonas lenta]MBB4081381.1 hypothetical protein [Brevundimonas lenta]
MAFVNALAWLGSGIVALTGAGQEAGQDFVPPAWSRPVSAANAAQMHPAFAGGIGIGGVATVKCRAAADGPPTECVVVREAPEGLGFGAAALQMLATAEVRAARLDGEVSPRWVQTNVNFLAPDMGAPSEVRAEPSPASLALARKLVDLMEADLPPPPRDLWSGGLDAERREVVRPWIDELMPRDPVRDREVRALQLINLFSDVELQRMIERKPVRMPSTEEMLAACPPPTPDELAAMAEIRRRYCARYACE